LRSEWPLNEEELTLPIGGLYLALQENGTESLQNKFGTPKSMWTDF
jgi:hypothetical protein